MKKLIFLILLILFVFSVTSCLLIPDPYPIHPAVHILERSPKRNIRPGAEPPRNPPGPPGRI